MKKLLLGCILALISINSLYTMQLPDLPVDIKRFIIEQAMHKKTLTQALGTLQIVAQTNKDFAHMLADQAYRKQLAQLLIQKLGTVANKERVAQVLNAETYKPCVTYSTPFIALCYAC